MIEISPNWHPVAVHFTIALSVVSVPLYLAYFTGSKNTWNDHLLFAAHLNLWLATLAAVITVVAGFSAFNSVTHDEAAHLAMIDHRNWALATGLTSLFCCGWSLRSFWKRRTPHALILVPLVALLGLVTVTGYKGAELVYRHGLGVLALPSPEGEHAHHHDSEAPDPDPNS